MTRGIAPGMERLMIPVWFKPPDGGPLRRGALEPGHPESTRSYVARLGHDPAEFGIPEDRCYDDR